MKFAHANVYDWEFAYAVLFFSFKFRTFKNFERVRWQNESVKILTKASSRNSPRIEL